MKTIKSKKLVDSIELPLGKYKATKLASTHNNIDKVSRGSVWGGFDNKNGYIVQVGKQFGLTGGDYEGLRTTEVKEIEIFPKYIIIKTQNSTYKIEEDNTGIYGNGKE